MPQKSTIFIPSTEPGVRLQVIDARPRTKGPYPTLIFNHGSTGRGVNPAVFKRAMRPAAVQNFFNERGWLVLFLQRRGRGKSEGQYDEGLASDGSGYSCEPEIALRGFDRAVEDVNAVASFVQNRDDIDLSRVVIGGISRGGILSVAYAGMSSIKLRGAINFSGGWLGKACPSHTTVNPHLFQKGAASDVPSLWLHGSKDQYYTISHCRQNFESFKSAGGKGSFVLVQGGHGLAYKKHLWEHTVDNYISQITS